MRNISKTLFVAFATFSILSVSAQTYSGFSDVIITLRSDSSTKSVLISNLLEDRVGDLSPIIGTAAWTENNKKLQCRSLLSFNYGALPKMISPEQIIEARLILKPLEMLTKESMNGTASPKFTVKRITEPWEDSMTSWLTQPLADPNDEVTKFIPEKKKHRTTWIDVTEIVQNMFRYGNNGFMISYADSLESSTFLSQWFASAKYEDEKLRPELQIRWSYPVDLLPNRNNDMAELSRMPPIRTVVSPSQQVVSQPYIPAPPVQQTPAPAPGPVKDQRK